MNSRFTERHGVRTAQTNLTSRGTTFTTKDLNAQLTDPKDCILVMAFPVLIDAIILCHSYRYFIWTHHELHSRCSLHCLTLRPAHKAARKQNQKLAWNSKKQVIWWTAYRHANPAIQRTVDVVFFSHLHHLVFA